MATKEMALNTPNCESAESGTSESGPTSSKTRSAARRPNLRVRPYPCDDKLPPLSKLSLAQDECTNKHCQCNLAKTASKDTEQHRLNYARLCSSAGRPRNYIQEAHLKLHHRNKDTRQLIRAARLHLVRGSSSSTKLSERSNATLPTVYETPGDVFGQGLASEAKDFASLVAEHMSQKGKEARDLEEAGKKGEAVGGVEAGKQEAPTLASGGKSGPAPTFKGASFGGYRAPPVPTTTVPGSFWGGSTVPSLQQESNAEGINLRDLEEGLLEVSSTVSDQGASAPPASAATRGASPSASHCPLHPGRCKRPCTCSDQARLDDLSVDELAGYFDDFVYIPRKMSKMAEMMYT